MADLLVVASKIKAHAKEKHDIRVSQKYLEAVSRVVELVIAKSVKNLTKKGIERVTLKPEDLLKPEAE